MHTVSYFKFEHIQRSVHQKVHLIGIHTSTYLTLRTRTEDAEGEEDDAASEGCDRRHDACNSGLPSSVRYQVKSNILDTTHLAAQRE